MQALDKVYNAPTFNRTAFQKICLNTAKTAKIGGNDYNCCANLEKLFLECERLADIAQQKSTLLNQQKDELERFEKEKQNLDGSKKAMNQLLQAQHELQVKDEEIEQLKYQLKKKSDECKALKEDKQRILKEQMAQLNKISSQAAGGPIEGQFRLEDLDQVIFDTFNKDLKKRLDFVGRILDWEKFADQVQGIAQADDFNPEVQDGELTAEHFTFRKSNLNYLMDRVYFPTIDAHEHLEMYTTNDFAIKLEHEKYQDMILVELITLQHTMKLLGYDAGLSTPGKLKKDCLINEHDRMIIGGLMKRLLNQIPVRIKGEKHTVKDFQAKMSNLYLLLRQRCSIKNAFEVSLDIRTQKAQDDIDSICERILSCIMDYDDFCQVKEEEAKHKNEMPQRILNLFQKKIAQKMMNLKNKDKKKYESSMIQK